MMASSTCLMVTGSSPRARTHADSHGAGHSQPVNSGKLLVACRRSMAARQWSVATSSFQSGIRLPSGQPSWQKATPQSMQRVACSRTASGGGRGEHDPPVAQPLGHGTLGRVPPAVLQESPGVGDHETGKPVTPGVAPVARMRASLVCAPDRPGSASSCGRSPTPSRRPRKPWSRCRRSRSTGARSAAPRAPPTAGARAGTSPVRSWRPPPTGRDRRPGTRVVGLVTGGGWAEQVAVPTSMLAPLPDELEVTAAATLPVAGLTAVRALAVAGRARRQARAGHRGGGRRRSLRRPARRPRRRPRHRRRRPARAGRPRAAPRWSTR